MRSWGRRSLRERFDDAHRPDPRIPVETHRCDRYLATDGSVVGGTAGLGAIVQDAEGEILGRWRTRVPVPDNNAAELLALHFGLDRLHRTSPETTRVGVLLDHEVLGHAVATCVHPEYVAPTRPPIRSASPHNWGGITARLAGFPDVRVAIVPGVANPAHRIAHAGAAD